MRSSPVDRAVERAVERVRADSGHDEALAACAELLGATVDEAARLARLLGERPVAVHFHPDRLASDGRMTVEGLLASGTYQNTFATGTSAGSAEAGRDGRRAAWEDHLFGDAYHGATPSSRPVYGALDVGSFPDGPAASFGSCHLHLAPQVNARTTFTFGDSHELPRARGSSTSLGSVLAASLQAAGAGRQPLGLAVDVPGLAAELGSPGTRGGPARVYDSYIEAQVHGPLSLRSDAVALTCDSSFLGTDAGGLLEQLAARCGLTLCWAPGFQLPLEEFPAVWHHADHDEPLDGPRAFATEVCSRLGEATLTAELLGRAARSMVTHPADWGPWGPPSETLQQVKVLWKVVVRAGSWDPPGQPAARRH